MPIQEKLENLTRHDEETKIILDWPEITDKLQEPIVLPNSVKLHLIRHAESEKNAEKRVTGSQDVKLTLRGEKQAEYLGQKLENYYDLAFTSTLQRSQKTLEVAVKSGKIKVEKVISDSRLNERSLGVLEGQKSRWIPEYACGDLNYAPEKGESYEKVAKRILSFFLDLSEDILQGASVNKVLISGHMGPMRIMLGILTSQEDAASVLGLNFSNTEVIKLTWKCLQVPGFLQNSNLISQLKK